MPWDDDPGRRAPIHVIDEPPTHTNMDNSRTGAAADDDDGGHDSQDASSIPLHTASDFAE